MRTVLWENEVKKVEGGEEWSGGAGMETLNGACVPGRSFPF